MLADKAKELNKLDSEKLLKLQNLIFFIFM
jgi:hypothetical protein